LGSRPRHHHPNTLPTSRHSTQSIRSQTLLQLSSRESSPTKGLKPLPLEFTILDLELLHFYTTTTSDEILGHHITGTHIWRTDAVTISFQHTFLLYELFSLAALHLAFLHAASPSRSNRYLNAATLYHLKSISTFRNELQNITRENSDACCACASLLGLHAWTIPGGRGSSLFFPDQETDKSELGAGIAWYKLHRGANEILKSNFDWIRQGPFWDMVRPWLTVSPQAVTHQVPTPLLEKESANLDAIAECWVSSCLNGDDKHALEETLQTLRLIFSMVSMMDIEISSCTATLSWTTIIPRRFCEMVEERCPQALILVAVYCVLLKRLDEFWWIRGKAESLMGAVRRELPVGMWDYWLEWPLRELEGSGMEGERVPLICCTK
jgi:hypothetical protein